MIKKIFNYNLKKIKRYFSKNKKSRILVAALMGLAIFLLSVGIYILTRRGLLETQSGTDPFLNKAVPLYIYQIFLLIISFLIFISASIFGLFSFFKKEHDSWIISSPQYDKLVWSKLMRAVLDSSWPIIIIAIPLLLAVKTVFELSFYSFVISFLSIFILSLFSTLLAISIIFLISIFLKLFKIKSFKVLSFSVATISLLFGCLIWSRVVSVDLESIFQFDTAKAGVEMMIANFSIFPSHLSAMVIYYLQENNFSASLKYLGGFLILLSFFLVIFKIIKSKYLYLWQTFQEGHFEAKEKTKEKQNKFSLNLTTKNIFFRKEALTFLRSPENIFWASFLSVLMFIQIGVINLLQKYIHLSNQLVSESLISSLQLGVVLFFISAIILRFVFPSFSQEGNTSWIIGSAPINLKEIFNKKFYFYSILITIIALVAFSFYLIPIPVSSKVILLFPLILIISCLSLTILGLSFGVVFINFETDSPQKLSTSGPGIGFILISLLYSIVGAYSGYSFLVNQNYIFLIIFVIISIFIHLAGRYFSLKSLNKIEFL